MKRKQQASVDWADSIRPWVEIANINVAAAQKYVQLQSDFLMYLMDMGYKQCSILADCKDPQSALERQFECIKKIDNQWCDTAEKEIEATRIAQQSVNDILKKNLHVPDFIDQLSTDQQH